MCEVDIEHLLYIFFDCPFATTCWEYTCAMYDMSSVENAPEWLIHMIDTRTTDEIIRLSEFCGAFGSFVRSGKIRQ